MTENVTIDASVLNQKLADLHDALIGQGQDASNIVRDEARLLLRSLIKYTPPKSLAQGRNAIAGDLMGSNALASKGIFFKIQDWMPISESKNMVTLFAKKDGAYGVVRHNYRPGASQHELKQWHVQYRSKKTGRTFRSKPEQSGRMFVLGRLAAKKASVNRYVLSVQRRVGRAKAAWAHSFKALGGKVPNWINRHLPTPKAIFINELNKPGFPFVILGSSAPGVRGLKHIINSAVRVRGEAIARKIKLVVSGYNKDFARQMRVSNKYRKDPASANLD